MMISLTCQFQVNQPQDSILLQDDDDQLIMVMTTQNLAAKDEANSRIFPKISYFSTGFPGVVYLIANLPDGRSC